MRVSGLADTAHSEREIELKVVDPLSLRDLEESTVPWLNPTRRGCVLGSPPTEVKRPSSSAVSGYEDPPKNDREKPGLQWTC